MSATATEVQAPAQAAPNGLGAEPATPVPQSADNPVAESTDKKDKEAKAKEAKAKEAKGKSKANKPKDAGFADDTPDSGAPSVAAHPRAARSVSRAKSWGALTGFFIAGYLSLSTGTLAETGLRALVAGCACYVAVWAGAVFVWRRLVIIEVKGREQQLLSDAHSAPAQGESAT